MNDASPYDTSFAQCMEAAGDPARHTLTVHMWEDKRGKNNKINTHGMEMRRQEIASMLGVMANDPGAHYSDEHYLGHSEFFSQDLFAHRAQDGHPQGIIGLATTPIFSNACIPVFSTSDHKVSKTGLLLKGSTPALVSPHDVWSEYYSKASYIPPQKAWDTICKRIDAHTPKEYRHLFAHYFLRDHPEFRPQLAGKLVVMRRIAHHPFDNITESQIGKSSEQLYTLVDPLSPEQLKKARQAYTELMHKFSEQPEVLEKWKHCEVDINATLDKAIGILAYNGPQNPAVDPSKPISDTLEHNIDLAQTLYRALKEHAQLAETQRAHGIKQEPTIVIYQPYAVTKLVHAPPTPQLQRIVEGVLKQQGLLKVENSRQIGG